MAQSVDKKGPMYSCEPYFTIQKIRLPDCMYVLPSPTYPITVRWPDVSPCLCRAKLLNLRMK